MISEEEFLKACKEGDTAIVKQYIAEGGDLDARDNNDWTGLILAAYHGHIECVRELIAASADVNEPDYMEGITALMMAARNGHIDCVRELIAAGADINARDNNETTAILWAIKKDHVDCLKELWTCCGNNAINQHGFFSVVEAIYHGSESCLRYLLSAGVDINIRSHDGENALVLTLDSGRYKNAILPIELGIDIYAKNIYGWTAIDYCEDVKAKQQLIDIYQRHITTAIKSADKPDIIKGFDPER